MPFSEKSDFKDERRPLLRDPVWHYNHRYGRGRGSYDQEEMEELFGRDHAKNQRFQWMLFLGVTLLSILILLGALAVLINLSEIRPSVAPKVPSTTVFPPSSKLPSTTSNPGLPVNASTSTTPSTSSPFDINVYVNKSSPQENT